MNYERPFVDTSLSITQSQLLAGLHVVLTVDIGEFEISVEELLDLTTGRVLQYEFDPLQPVTLRLDAAEIAKAQFVSNEGKIMLKIISVADESGANEGEHSSDNISVNMASDRKIEELPSLIGQKNRGEVTDGKQH